MQGKLAVKIVEVLQTMITCSSCPSRRVVPLASMDLESRYAAFAIFFQELLLKCEIVLAQAHHEWGCQEMTPE